MAKELATLAPLQPVEQKPSLADGPRTLNPAQGRQPLAPPGLQTFRDMQRAGQARPPSPSMAPRMPSPVAPVRTPAPQLSVGATAGGNGYTVENGVLTGSNYGRNGVGYKPQQEGQPLQRNVTFDYSPERSHNGYADISDEQYQELIGLGETNVAENMESYTDENGQTRWRYAAGAQGHSGDDSYYGGNAHDVNGYAIDSQGNRLDPNAPPRDPSSRDYARYAGTTGGNVVNGPQQTQVPAGGRVPYNPRGRSAELTPFTGPGANLVSLGTTNVPYTGQPDNKNTPPRQPAEVPGPYDPGPRYTPPPITGGPTAGDMQGGFDPLDFMEGRMGGSAERMALQERLRELIDNPSGWTSDLIQQEMRRGGEAIDDQYALDQQGLTEEMASRGLSDSSIYGGRRADLNATKKSALTDLNERVLANAASGYGNDRRAALDLATDFEQQGFGNDMQTLMAMLGFGQQGFENDMETQRFMQELQKWQDQLAMFGAVQGDF